MSVPVPDERLFLPVPDERLFLPVPDERLFLPVPDDMSCIFFLIKDGLYFHQFRQYLIFIYFFAFQMEYCIENKHDI